MVTNLSNLEGALHRCYRSVSCRRGGSPVVTGVVLPVPKDSIYGMVRIPSHGEIVLSMLYSTN
jgi:hypothetical protein